MWPPCGTRLLYDVSYVDDTVFPLYANYPHNLLAKLQRVTSFCVEAFKQFGMDLNFRQGKAEAILDLRWVRTQKVRRELDANNRRVVCSHHRGKPVALQAVRAYKHLGTKAVVGASVFLGSYILWKQYNWRTNEFE